MGLEQRARTEGAVFELASTGGTDVGFLVAVPDGERLEVVYLATDPQAWGRGVGSALLARVDDLATEHESLDLVLWVIDDNHRAVDVYERAGWCSTGTVRPHETPGRLERLMRRRPR